MLSRHGRPLVWAFTALVTLSLVLGGSIHPVHARPAADPALASLLAPLGAGDGVTAPKVLAQTGDSLTVAMWSPPNNFNPINTDSWYGLYPSAIIFDSLVFVDPKATYIPRLATWEFSSDNSQVTFYINKNATWHDGTPVTAGDYEWTVRTIANPKTETNRSNNLAALVGTNANGRRDGEAELGIKVIDDKTVQLTMKRPVDQFYVLEKFGLGFSVLPKHILGNLAPEELSQADFFQKPTVGSGPFKFVKYETSQYIELERNDDYYQGQPVLSKLYIRIVGPQVMVANLEKGEVDATAGPGIGDIPLDDWDRVKSNPSFKTASVTTLGYQFMDINVANPLMADKRVRQALVYGINRQLIVNQLLKGEGRVANGPIPPITLYYNQNLQEIPYDPNKARQLLTEAGWDFNQEVQLSVPTGNLVRERSADIIKANLDAIGFKVRIQKMDFPTLQSEATQGKYVIRLVGWGALLDPDVSSQFRTGGLYNYGKFSNPDLDRLIDEGLVEPNFEKRKAIYDEIQVRLQEEVPVVFLYHQNGLQAASARTQNIEYWGYTAGILWNSHLWGFK